MRPNEFRLLLTDFGMCCRIGLPENLFSNREVASLLWAKVALDELAIRATKVVECVCPILPNVDFAVWIRDLVDDHHCMMGR